MKVYVCMSDQGYNDHIDKIFLNIEDAEKYRDYDENIWIEEHEVIE